MTGRQATPDVFAERLMDTERQTIAVGTLDPVAVVFGTGADAPVVAQSSRRATSSLSPHPMNDTIYRDRADDDLVMSVKLFGVLNPLLIAADGTIISGHRRWDAARIVGLPTVPVVVSPLTDDLDIQQAVIESNRQRQKTNEQLGREAKALLDIETERAKRRQATSGPGAYGAKPLPDNCPEAVDTGDARDLAGEQLGISGKKVTKLVSVIDAVDTLRAKGQPEAAAELLQTLNERSAHAAYTTAKDKGYIATNAQPPKTEGPHVVNNGGKSEWYTPQEYIDAAVAVMGQIDLDPASTAIANTVVKARTFYTEENDSFASTWAGNVWMNPPYSQPLISQFVNKLVEEYEAGNVSQAIVLVNNATETIWFNNLVYLAAAVCFPIGRVRFWTPDRIAAPLQGQAVVYLGNNVEAFIEKFHEFGWTAEVKETCK